MAGPDGTGRGTAAPPLRPVPASAGQGTVRPLPAAATDQTLQKNTRAGNGPSSDYHTAPLPQCEALRNDAPGRLSLTANAFWHKS